ncbi:uncharacterized protein PHALS_00767 [Plasmopara halstedii]|uniref:Uncharacterized protein n=1 Tax=Plasmopara halstedii TaxID=4781 RepID=A0A0P1AV21_PLAHL|nr:uncharacterized protein PHALS_00767 [Plasmopara halstedii]CEG44399.1 hypothetical protein PHALS_00767 [Plasmopara halstedii]|eukprot:XP_024580768.1 hypothetical protein PHALS_00767 [Plasmopara halstedii]
MAYCKRINFQGPPGHKGYNLIMESAVPGDEAFPYLKLQTDSSKSGVMLPLDICKL